MNRVGTTLVGLALLTLSTPAAIAQIHNTVTLNPQQTQDFQKMLGAAQIVNGANTRIGKQPTVSTPAGRFTQQDLQEAGGDPFYALQIRQDRENYQALLQQAQSNQNRYDDQLKRQDAYFKQHPEEAKAFVRQFEQEQQALRTRQAQAAFNKLSRADKEKKLRQMNAASANPSGATKNVAQNTDKAGPAAKSSPKR